MSDRAIDLHRISVTSVILSCAIATLGCSSRYEPEGQFWSESVASGLQVDSAAADDVGAEAPTIGPVGFTPGPGGQAVNESPGGGTPRLDQNSGASLSGESGSNSGGGGAVGTGGGGSAVGAGGGSAVGAGGGSSAGATGASMEGSPTGDIVGATEPDLVNEAVSATCSLRVSVTTTAPGGKYRPRNVGAIWIADSSGQFVKSLEVWGNKRLSHVTAWNDATRAAGVAKNKVDAVTSATLSAHRTHDVSWNCEDHVGEVMPDDTYRVYFEVTDSNGSGPNHFETFTKGPMAATVESSAANFDGIVLTFTP